MSFGYRDFDSCFHVQSMMASIQTPDEPWDKGWLLHIWGLIHVSKTKINQGKTFILREKTRIQHIQVERMLDAPFFPNYKAHRKQTLGSLINQPSRYQALRNVKCLGLCSYVAINSKILKSSFVSVTIIECINTAIYCNYIIRESFFLLLKQFC